MRIFDKRYRSHIKYFLLQSLIAGGVMLAILLVIDIVSSSVIIAVLGATTFICFTIPKNRLACPRLIIGGYVVGMSSGFLCRIIVLSLIPHSPHYIMGHEDVIFGALAVALTMFLMTMTDTEHAPAAGLALSIVLSPYSLKNMALVLFGVVSLSLLKELLKPYLIDLL